MWNWVVFSSGQKWTFRIVFTCFLNCYVLYFSPMQSSFCNLSSNGSSILFFCNGRLILSLEQTSLFKLFSQYLSKESKIFFYFFCLCPRRFFQSVMMKINTIPESLVKEYSVASRRKIVKKVENHTASIRSVYFRINEIEKERFKRKKETLGKTKWIFVVII